MGQAGPLVPLRTGGKAVRLAVSCYALLVMTSWAFAQTPQERLPTCLACHGATGTSETDGVPSLGGQPADYLLVQLVLFREKQRVADPMNAMAEGISDDDLRALADAAAKLPAPKAAAAAADASLAAEGRDLVTKYRCNSCHGAGLAGEGQIPRLAGQREDYLAKSLTGYKSNSRSGYDPAMNEVAQEIKAEDIPVLAKYLSTYH
jgi:cytochrome c553